MTEEKETKSVAEQWHFFLIERVWAENYQTYFMVKSNSLLKPAKGYLFEKMLPSLLHIKALTILDYALKEALAARQVSPKSLKCSDDLSGRINAADKLGLFPDSDLLHTARLKRNGLAHEYEPSSSWDELKEVVVTIHKTLELLGVVSAPFPDFKVIWSRTPQSPDNPDEIAVHFNFRFAIMLGEEEYASESWTRNFHRLNSP
ncbi:MAG: hypothetical protein ACO1RA_08680 [Planctomycetaceae bacterium]